MLSLLLLLSFSHVFFVSSQTLQITPFGTYPTECVHEVPSGSTVDDQFVVTRPDGSTYQLQSCNGDSADVSRRSTQSRSEYNGFQAYTSLVNTTGSRLNITLFESLFTVPRSPIAPWDSSRSPLVNIFPALDNFNTIVRPVLQWGSGGGFWQMRNYYVRAYNVIHDTGFPVSEGDVIAGFIQTIPESKLNCTWINISHPNQRGTLIASRLANEWYDAARFAVETYNVDSCDGFPVGNVTFSDVTVTVNGVTYQENRPAVGFTWNITRQSTCATVTSLNTNNGDTTITFSSSNQTPSTTSSNTVCTSGTSRCSSSSPSSYQICDRGSWTAFQSCQAGLVCSNMGDYAYCVRPSSSSSSSTSSSSSSSSTSSGSSSSNCPVNGYMRCTGSNTYQICDHSVWSSPKACGSGQCRPSDNGNYIYCY